MFVKRFNAAAQPLQFIDYLLETPERAVVISADGILVNVPSPARFALHKLVVAEMRPSGLQTKANKDRAQADAVLEVLVESRPGDLGLAWEAAGERPSQFMKLLAKGVRAMKRRAPKLASRLRSLHEQ